MAKNTLLSPPNKVQVVSMVKKYKDLTAARGQDDESGLYYFPFCTNKNIIIPPIVKETKECYCTYSKHTPTNKKLWFKNLLENIKS